MRKTLPWRTISCALAVLLLISGVSAKAWLRPPEDMFRLVTATEPTHDFGRVIQGEALRHEFALQNGWSHPIQVEKVWSSCSCATAQDIVGRVIEPGKALPLGITLNTAGTDGPRAGTVTIYYRGPGQLIPAWKSLSVRAEVGTDYQVRPSSVDFGVVRYDERVTRTIRLRPMLMHDVRVTRVDCDQPSVTANLVPHASTVGDAQIELAFRADWFDRSGPLAATVQIFTNSPRSPVASVFVRAYSLAAVEIEPSSVVVGANVIGPVTRTITIRGERPFRISAARAGSVGVDDAARETASEDRLTIRIPENDGERAINDMVEFDVQLRLPTGADEVRTARVPVHRLPKSER
jgi:hypothetical protein